MLLWRRGPRTVYRHPVNAELFNAPPIGARIADAATGFIGSWKFIAVQTVIVVIWIVGNVYLIFNFDPYPFILLNLAFSTQAAYAAPLILLAETRQADRDKVQTKADAEHREEIARRHSELLEANTKLTEQVERLTEEIHRRVVGA